MTYGTAKLKNGFWVVQAEPHVMMRLRRIFPRGQKSGGLAIKATDEVSRDLLWFTERFPLDVDPPDALLARAAAHDRRVADCRALLSGAITPQAFDMAIPPRDYQRLAADMALRTGGLLLADDVGLGKTCSAICMLTDPRTRPALVVTLTHLPLQWARELARFAPKLSVHVIAKAQPYDIVHAIAPRGRGRPRLVEGQPELFERKFPDVLVISYSKLAGWADVLSPLVRSVVFDEVQELRRGASQKATAGEVLAQAATFRLGLSATPIYNYGGEFWNVLQAIRPDALGSRAEFETEWCVAGTADQPEKARIKNPAAFGSYVRDAGLMLRRTRHDVSRELPALTKAIHFVDTDQKPLAEIETAAAELARILLARESGWEERGQAARDLDWRLRQATGLAKALHVADFVRLLVESGEKVVLYGWHREVYALWMKRLEDLAPVMYTGSESPTQKEAARRLFVEGDAKVLVMSLRAGAGLDGLQAVCRTVVIGELDWSPGVLEQCIGRVYRDGQADPVVAYYLLSDSGSDPVISEVLGLKRQQIEAVRDPNAPLVETADGKGDALKRLATEFLRRRGEGPLMEAEPAAEPSRTDAAEGVA